MYLRIYVKEKENCLTFILDPICLKPHSFCKLKYGVKETY